jgi:hypothetical protein
MQIKQKGDQVRHARCRLRLCAKIRNSPRVAGLSFVRVRSRDIEISQRRNALRAYNARLSLSTLPPTIVAISRDGLWIKHKFQAPSTRFYVNAKTLPVFFRFFFFFGFCLFASGEQFRWNRRGCRRWKLK